MNVTSIKCGSNLIVSTTYSPSATQETTWRAVPQDPHKDLIELIDKMKAHFVRKVICRNETNIDGLMDHMARLSQGIKLQNIAKKEKDDLECVELKGKTDEGDSYTVNIFFTAEIYPEEAEVQEIWEKLSKEAILFVKEEKYDSRQASILDAAMAN